MSEEVGGKPKGELNREIEEIVLLDLLDVLGGGGESVQDSF